MVSLPIETLVPTLLESLRSHPNCVLQAEPGAGKTTHIPLVLLREGWAETGEVLITQPRRLAARMAAYRVAALLGERPGERCGFQVRYETKVSANTRLRFMTEGMLTRRLRSDPHLYGVSTVILDEFHERHLEADLLLALLRRLQRLTRPDLRILVMSATLNAEPVAAFLEAPALHCAGRTFPIEIEFVPRTSDRSVGQQTAEAFRQLLDTSVRGSILAFLPGAREIRDAHTLCTGIAQRAGFEVLRLHGELSTAEQERVTAPSSSPRLILATNIAETSITLEGVDAVIDSGLVRRPSHNPWTGLPMLALCKISQASAQQRAGRAGRTHAGRCIRLYTQHDFERRAAFDPPEILRQDLSEILLDLHAQGIESADDLSWLEPPPPAALETAQALLRRLGAVDEHGKLLPCGKDLLEMPAHPRLGRLLLEGRTRRIPNLVCGVAAILAERPIRRPDGATLDATEADVLADLQQVEQRMLEPARVHAIRQARDQFRKLLGNVPERAMDRELASQELCQALLLAYPDRVARRREGTDIFLFADGGSATLAAESVVHHADWIVALVADEQHHGTSRRILIRSAAQIESDWLLEAFSDDIHEHVDVRFDPASERLEAVEELRYGALIIERRALRQLPPGADATLKHAALERGPAAFVRDPQQLEQLRHRCGFCRRFDDSIPELTADFLRATLAEMCVGRRSFAELRNADFLAHLWAQLPPSAAHTLETLAPSHVSLPGGRRLSVHYESDRDPWVQSHLQDFFGLAQGPSLARGQVPLVLHLLAPNRRPVQVTTDLRGFWERHYPDLRRALMRRYPKHAWPDDPLVAAPPAPRRKSRD